MIAVGLPVHEAAGAIGISSTFMSTVKNSRQGREYLAELNALADNYAACIVALGITPGQISRSIRRTRSAT